MTSSTTSEVGYETKTTRWISWKSLETYGDREFWNKNALLLKESVSQRKDLHIVKMLEESLARWKEGKNDSDGHFLRDF